MSDTEPGEESALEEEPHEGTAADRRRGSLSKRDEKLARERGRKRILGVRAKKHANDSKEKRLKKARNLHFLTKKQQFKDIRSSIEELKAERRRMKEEGQQTQAELLKHELRTLKKYREISERIWRTHKQKHGEAGKHARKMEKIVSQFRGRLLPDRSRRASAFQNLQMRAERKRFMQAKKESVKKRVKK